MATHFVNTSHIRRERNVHVVEKSKLAHRLYKNIQNLNLFLVLKFFIKEQILIHKPAFSQNIYATIIKHFDREKNKEKTP